MVKLENWQVQNIHSREEITKQLNKIETSSKIRYGVLKITTKNEKLEKLKTAFEEIKNRIEIGKELLKIVCFGISEIEIPFLKTQRKRRLLEICHEFGRKQIEKVKEEIAFWKCLGKIEDNN